MSFIKVYFKVIKELLNAELINFILFVVDHILVLFVNKSPQCRTILQGMLHTFILLLNEKFKSLYFSFDEFTDVLKKQLHSNFLTWSLKLTVS
jgi:hypothetical protein